MSSASENTPEKSSVAGNAPLEGQQQKLQDDSACSTTDDTEGQNLMASNNDDVASQSSQSLSEDDHTYANVGGFYRVASVKSEKPALSTSLEPVAGAK